MTMARQTEHFLKGPIPWRWIERAAQLPGQALAVGLVCWLWSGMRQSSTIWLSSRHAFPALGISRYAVYRALAQLEQARLISLRRRCGHPPLITIRSVTVCRLDRRTSRSAVRAVK